MWCCCANVAVIYILVCINIISCLFTYRLGLNHQLLLVDIASLASLSFLVIKSLIGNIQLHVSLHEFG